MNPCDTVRLSHQPTIVTVVDITNDAAAIIKETPISQSSEAGVIGVVVIHSNVMTYFIYGERLFRIKSYGKVTVSNIIFDSVCLADSLLPQQAQDRIKNLIMSAL